MVAAVPIAKHKSDTALKSEHHAHFLGEGFTTEEIGKLEDMGVRSFTLQESLAKHFKVWNGTRWVSDEGWYAPFNKDFGQLRFNTPLKDEKGKSVKYLTPYNLKISDLKMKAAYTPDGVIAYTEGFKDAAMPTLRGVPVGALPGVGMVHHILPEGCGKTLIFDSDGWTNPDVMRALLTGSIWTGGKVQLFPVMPKYPKGGSCEFFKSGYTADDLQALLNDAMTPMQLIEAWAERWDQLDSDKQSQSLAIAIEFVERLKDPQLYIEKKKADIAKKAR